MYSEIQKNFRKTTSNSYNNIIYSIIMEKSAVFIDAENVINGWWEYCAQSNSSSKIDYIKLINYLSKETNLLRAYFYDGVPDKISVKKNAFFQALEHSGIQLRTKALRNRFIICDFCKKGKNKQIQKGVDVSLATDILRHGLQKSCDICIVVSGDEDFKDAIELVKDRGIKVWVCSFKSSLSSELRRTADKIILLDDIFEKIKR